MISDKFQKWKKENEPLKSYRGVKNIISNNFKYALSKKITKLHFNKMSLYKN